MTDPTPSRALTGRDVYADPVVRELLGSRVVCILATYNVDSIHAVPMWFAWYRRRVLLATGEASRKAANLVRDLRATVVLHDSRPGFEICGAMLGGRAEIVRGSAAVPLIERVHRRYVTAAGEDSPAVRGFLASDDVALRMRIEGALVWDERESEANAELRKSGGALPLVPTSPRR